MVLCILRLCLRKIASVAGELRYSLWSDGIVLCTRSWGGGDDDERRAREYAEWMNSRYGNRSKTTAS